MVSPKRSLRLVQRGANHTYIRMTCINKGDMTAIRVVVSRELEEGSVLNGRNPREGGETRKEAILDFRSFESTAVVSIDENDGIVSRFADQTPSFLIILLLDSLLEMVVVNTPRGVHETCITQPICMFGLLWALRQVILDIYFTKIVRYPTDRMENKL